MAIEAAGAALVIITALIAFGLHKLSLIHIWTNKVLSLPIFLPILYLRQIFKLEKAVFINHIKLSKTNKWGRVQILLILNFE